MLVLHSMQRPLAVSMVCLGLQHSHRIDPAPCSDCHLDAILPLPLIRHPRNHCYPGFQTGQPNLGVRLEESDTSDLPDVLTWNLFPLTARCFKDASVHVLGHAATSLWEPHCSRSIL